MNREILPGRAEIGERAALLGAERIRAAIEEHGESAIVVATGTSQFGVLAALAAAPGIRWDRVTAFHLDEYLGMPITHPASFRRFLWERFARCLPLPLHAFHYLNGEAPDPAGECKRVGRLLLERRIDAAFIGIGENGHVAFNDPPADFETEAPYLVVELDDACRRQQLGEGWFPSLEDVPRRAISMSCCQILKAERIVCSVPDLRKARAVRDAVEGPVTPLVPASILQTHSDIHLLLDSESASLLSGR